MITETTAMQTTAIYSDDKTHRYLLRKEWNSEKKSAEIIMLYPSSADTVTVDHTTMFVLRNLERLNYGREPLKTGVKSKNGQGVPASRKADEVRLYALRGGLTTKMVRTAHFRSHEVFRGDRKCEYRKSVFQHERQAQYVRY